MTGSALTRCKVLVPAGVLGAGCPDEAMERGIALGPDCIAVDGGSTDSGPYYLGTGKSKMTRGATKHDLRQLMLARDRLKVPLFIGSCGTCGTDSGVNWMADIVREIAREEALTLRLALIYSEIPGDLLKIEIGNGTVTPLEPAQPLRGDVIEQCSHIVGLLGYEPLAKAMEDGADIILSGRTTDTAVIAALPLARGFPAGPTWHAAKIAECGGLCTTQTRRGGVLISINGDGFDIEPLHVDNQCTPYTVSAHLLYENADPWRLKEPGVILDAGKAAYRAVDERSVRVTGSEAIAMPYTMKLEGSGPTGFRTMVFTGIADPKILNNFQLWRTNLEAHLRSGIERALGLGRSDYALEFRPYGGGALLPVAVEQPAEIGLMTIVTAPSQERATEVAKFCNPILLHFPLTAEDPLPSFAFPFSPAEVELGQQFEFKLNHVVHLNTPYDFSRTVHEIVGEMVDG